MPSNPTSVQDRTQQFSTSDNDSSINTFAIVSRPSKRRRGSREVLRNPDQPLKRTASQRILTSSKANDSMSLVSVPTGLPSAPPVYADHLQRVSDQFMVQYEQQQYDQPASGYPGHYATTNLGHANPSYGDVTDQAFSPSPQPNSYQITSQQSHTFTERPSYTSPHLPSNYNSTHVSSNSPELGYDYYATTAQTTVNPVPDDASLSYIIQNLPLLDQAADHILATLSKGSFQEIVAIVTDSRTLAGQSYAAMRTLFEDTKKPYTRDNENFIEPRALNITRPDHVESVHKANVATFVSCIFGSNHIGFWELHDRFLEIFVRPGTFLSQLQGALLLELKTQAYISSMYAGNRSKQQLICAYFPKNLPSHLLARHPSLELNNVEHSFLAQASIRRQQLLAEQDTRGTLDSLAKTYNWMVFLERLGNCQQILPRFGESIYVDNYAPSLSTESTGLSYDQAEINHGATIAVPQEIVMPNIKLEQDENPTMYPEFSQPRQSAYHTIPGMLDAPPVPPTQSEPTQVLYERARTAAQAKGPPNGRKSTVPSQRRPWSEEEERALMDGVDRVKGPHWSQILALYGAGGSISEVLKDRNQVQLKDKARNLKLFFLKSKLEVPYYLQGVTGDLRTRAPNVLAREEAQRQLQESKLREDQSGHSVDGSGTLSPPNHHGHTVERVPTANMNPAQYSQIAPQPTGDVRQAVKQAFLHAHHHQHGENSPYDYDRISGQHPRP